MRRLTLTGYNNNKNNTITLRMNRIRKWKEEEKEVLTFFRIIMVFTLENPTLCSFYQFHLFFMNA